MKVNYDFYTGKDEYSDGDIEKDIINYLKQYGEDGYKEIFQKDIRWPVLYHITPIRKNILKWYPFKKNAEVLEIGAGMGAITGVLCDKAKYVTSVELSKQRASAIETRCKDRNNLEIIVGNFNDIKFSKKFDYITLIGVLEYAPLYTNTANPFHDFLTHIKGLLKEDGKLLIAIENQFGMKYFSGAPEDHTSKIYDGITGYENKNRVCTFGKEELKEVLKQADFNYTKFYYPLPDYKLPNIIFSDEYKPDKEKLKLYTPYLSYENISVTFDEKKAYEEVIKNNQFDFFANSFLIEASQKEFETNVDLENQDLFKIDEVTQKFYNNHYEIKNPQLQQHTPIETVDILLATYNGEKYVAEQIESILNQTYKNIRLVISDDCSTDKTREILKQYENDTRVEIHLQKSNLGSTRNFEYLLKQVKNDLYMLSDQDDVWLEGKVEKSVELLKKENADILFTDLEVVNQNLETIYPSFNDLMLLNKKINKMINSKYLNYLYNCVTGCTLISRKKFIYDKILPLPHKSKYLIHDHWISLMVSIYGKSVYIPEKYIKYRQHKDNQFGTNKVSHSFKKFEQVRRLFIDVKLGMFGTYVENNERFPEDMQKLNTKALDYYKMIEKKKNFNFKKWGVFHELYKNETFMYRVENFFIMNLPFIAKGLFRIRHGVLVLTGKR